MIKTIRRMYINYKNRLVYMITMCDSKEEQWTVTFFFEDSQEFHWLRFWGTEFQKATPL